MPSMQKSVYEGFYNMFVGLGCILGPLVGNLLRVNMPVFSGDIFPDSQIRLVFIVSFIANSLLILYLYLNKKKYNDIAVSK